MLARSRAGVFFLAALVSPWFLLTGQLALSQVTTATISGIVKDVRFQYGWTRDSE